MVSVAVSLLGTTELMFIEPGVKINGVYYRDVLLGQHHRLTYSMPDAVPPIHAESSHVATDKVPSK